MKKISTIQKRGKLNDVYALGEVGNGNSYHNYEIYKSDMLGPDNLVGEIDFQHGPRFEDGSQHGVSTMDLLEICRSQLAGFQSGDMATRENEKALTHVEEALLWLNKRAEDRLDRNVLGTTQK